MFQIPESRQNRRGEEGFLLVGVIVMVALVLLALSIAAPIVAKDLRREKELETMHRGQQYVRAIRTYYQKVGSYPASMEQLEKTNNIRYLRHRYVDPMTGKIDWRLIPVGQAKTTVKGFFGQPLSGLNSSGLGSAAGSVSNGLGGALGGTNGPGSGIGSTGSNGTSPTGSTTNSSNTFGSSSFGSGSSGTNGTGSDSGSGFGSGGSTGPFIGVGIPKEGASIIELNEQTDYSTWEFIYDPRIEQLYAKWNLFGGGGTSTSTSSLGSASGLSSTPGTGSSTNPNTTTSTPVTPTPPAPPQ
jgi:type II secretory pathway pseudopilin PulG